MKIELRTKAEELMAFAGKYRGNAEHDACVAHALLRSLKEYGGGMESRYHAQNIEARAAELLASYLDEGK